MLPVCRRVFCLLIATLTVAAAAPAQTRVAIVGLVHGHVSGFLDQLPSHTEVQLVGVSDPDAALREKYSQKYHLDPKIFFPTEDAMIEATHPQAVLVYTSIAGHRAAIEVAARCIDLRFAASATSHTKCRTTKSPSGRAPARPPLRRARHATA